MSKYLSVGIAKEIIVEANDEDMAKRIVDDFFEKVDRNLYNVELDRSEEKQKIYIYFELKDDMLAEHAMDLMIEQNKKYI